MTGVHCTVFFPLFSLPVEIVEKEKKSNLTPAEEEGEGGGDLWQYSITHHSFCHGPKPAMY